MNATQQQMLALSGVMLACKLVDEIAQYGKIDNDELTLAVSATLNLTPNSTDELYSPRAMLARGILDLSTLLDRGNLEHKGINSNQLRYMMSILHLTAKFSKNSQKQTELSNMLKKSNQQKEYFGDFCHTAVIGSLANAYKECLSSFKFRIQVTGDANILQQERYADQVRALLLFGVRSAFLWQQLGGHRWHLIFKKGAYLKALKAL